MAIMASVSGGNFTPHPEGQFPAVCVDVVDLGMMEVTFDGTTKMQHKIDVYFYCGEQKPDDESFPLFVRQRFTLTLNTNGRLRPFLEAWRGRAFTAEEEKGFDVEKLLSAPAFIQVTHNHVGDKTYANITTIMKLPKQMTAPAVPPDYVRVCDRPKEDEQRAAQPIGGEGHAPAHHGKPWEDEDDDLPF